MILLDTVVVSEFRKARPSPKVLAWLRGHSESDLHLSVVTLGEIERGIAMLRDDAFSETLRRWLAETVRSFADRTLDVTPPIARLWGRWTTATSVDPADALIAATASVHGLTIATRNVRDFRPFTVEVVDPFR